jgi:glycyl-tRNA synthetase
MDHSHEDLSYLDPFSNERYVPYCVEPSVGVERLFLAFICDAYEEEKIEANGAEDVRTVLHLSPILAPYKAAVLPLSKKLSEPARKIYEELTRSFAVDYDEAGSIGKRYRRQDAIGTPYCITVDFDSEQDGAVTVRDRDSMAQQRIPVGGVKDYIAKQLEY